MTVKQSQGKTQMNTGNDPENHIGAVEGDRPGDVPNQGNPNAPGVDEEGLPNDPVATSEDALGATLDETEGG
jgi:hypothetical protein